MNSNREERLQMRQRGAASRKTKEVDFGFAFGLGAPSQQQQQQQQPQQQHQQQQQQQQQHAPASPPKPDPSQQQGQRTPRSARNALPERPSMFDIPPDDDEDASPLRSIKRRKTETPSRISRTPSRSGSRRDTTAAGPAAQRDESAVPRPDRNGQLNGEAAVPPPLPLPLPLPQDAKSVPPQPLQPPQDNELARPEPPQLPKTTVPPPSRTKSPSPRREVTQVPETAPEAPQEIPPDANERIQESTAEPVQIQTSTLLQGVKERQTIPKEPSPQPPEPDVQAESLQLPEPDIQEPSPQLQPESDIQEQIELPQLEEPPGVPAEEPEELQPDTQEQPELPEEPEQAEPESPKRPKDTKGKRKRQQEEAETTGRPPQADVQETPRDPVSRQDKGKEPDRAERDTTDRLPAVSTVSATAPPAEPPTESQESTDRPQPKTKRRGRPRKSTDTQDPDPDPEPSQATDRQTKRRGRPSKKTRPAASTPAEEPEPEEEEEEEGEGEGEEDQSRSRNRPGETVPVTVHRLANIGSLQNIVDTQAYNSDSSESADELSTRQRTKHPHRGGVNQADVLSQICRETLEKTLTTLKNGIASETNAARRAEWTRKKKAVEAFGTELDGRLFEMSEMLDSNFVLGVKLRRAKREMLEMRSRLYHVRREREEVAVHMDDLRRRFAEEEAVRISRTNINNTLHSLELAVDSPREHEGNGTTGLEYLVRSVAEEVSSRGGGGGLLDQIKAFNAELELI